MKHSIILLGILFISSSLSHAQANCNEEPPSGLSPLAAYSLFYENYRNGDYDFALNYGRWILCAKPETLQGNPKFSLKTQYERLITIYEEIGRSKEDPAERTAYIDTARILFNESLELFGDNQEDRYDIIFNRGRFYQQNYNYIDDGLQKAYSDYETLFELNPEKAVPVGNGYYLRQALNNIIKQGRKEDAQNFIDRVKPYAEGEILEFIEEKQQEILGSPEEQIGYFEPIVEEDPSNIEAWKALESAYRQLGDRSKLREVQIKINELEPTYKNAINIAELAKSNANYTEAEKYFQQALDRASTDEQRKEAYLDLADANISLEKLRTAKEHVQSALEIDPNDGNIYLKMAGIYVEAVSQCTKNRKLEAQDRVVYWVVIDYLNKAKNVDSSVASTVNRQLSNYEAVTPTSEDKFFTLDLQNGDQINVDGSLMPCYDWINETTTVR